MNRKNEEMMLKLRRQRNYIAIIWLASTITKK